MKPHIPILCFDNKKSQHRLDLLRKIPDSGIVQEVSCISHQMRTGQENIIQLTSDLDIIGDYNSIVNEAN